MTRIRALVYWSRVHRAVDVGQGAALRPARSRRLPGRHLGPARPAGHRGRRARHRGHAHAHGPGAGLGDEEAQRRHHAAERQAVRPLGHRGGAPLRRPRRPLVDLERAEPPALPRAAVQERAARLAADLPRALPRGGEGDPRRARRRPRQGAVRRDGARRHVARWSSRSVFLRRALCLSESYERDKGCNKVRMEGFAHHAYARKGNPFFRSDEAGRGLDRHARPAHEGARPGGEGRARSSASGRST